MAQHQPQVMEPHRAEWKTQWGFLLAAMGSAIGLGNIWRFPYLCYENGGGAFLIPYAVALLTAGLPLMILEYGIGHRMRGSAPMTFAKINPHWEWLGWWTVIFVMFGITLYYCVVLAWCVNYMALSVNLAWGPDPNTYFFHQFLGMTSGPFHLGQIRTPILVSLAVVWLINWAIVFFGVEHGIERANKFFIPFLFFITLVLVAWTLTLPGAKDGVRQYLKPDFSRLAAPKVWMDAFTQVFFSLSLGFGIMITYASYLPRKADINLSACATCLADTAYAFLAGFAVFGTLGYMMHQTGQPMGEVVQESVGLAFVTYPKAIGLLPVFPGVFGFLFFLALAIAGITSSVSIVEAFTSAVIDKFHCSRKATVTVLSVIGCLGGIVFTTGGGLSWLDIVDHFLTQYGLFLASILQCLVVGWVFGAGRLREYANSLSAIRVGGWWSVCIRYVTPAILGLLLLNAVLTDFRKPYGGYSWLALVLIGRDWLLFTLIAALVIAMRPWRKTLSGD